MEHFFDLPVSYRGEALQLRGRLVTFGYSYKIYVIYEGHEIAFEKDDAGEFRALQENADPFLTMHADIYPAIIESLVVQLE